MLITIPNYRTASWNTLWSGAHWTVRQSIADEAHWLVLIAVKEQHPDCEPFPYTVDIKFEVFFDVKPQDTDNLLAKPSIDGLRHAGVLTDDTIDQVGWVCCRSYVDKDRPRVEIRLTRSAGRVKLEER